MGEKGRREFMKASYALGSSLGLAACLARSSGHEYEDSIPDDSRAENASARTSDDAESASARTDRGEAGLSENGTVVFVYDDGPIEDFTTAFPVHQEFDMPASTGIVTDWIGRTDFQGTDWMEYSQLGTLADAGWEITSHTTRHTALAQVGLVEDAAPSDRRIYPESLRHGYHAGTDLEITDGDRRVRRTVVGTGEDDAGRYIELDDDLGAAFAAAETVERYPADLMHEFLGGSKRELEDAGFEIRTLLAPYDAYDDWARSFAEQYYDGVANARHGSRLNDPDAFDPYWTRRDYFIEYTSPESVERDLDRIATQGALGVFGAHTFKAEVTRARIRRTLELVAERGIDVLTLREAISRAAT